MAGNGEERGGPIPYQKDPRTPCKYGKKCYQKNPAHRQKYKHPPEKVEDINPVKKQKLDHGEKVKKVPSPLNKQAISKEKVESTSFENSSKTLNIPDEEDLPLTPENEKDAIKQKFLVEMPDDFYSFWAFCKSLSSEKPEEALKDVGLLLVGPFDILSGKLKKARHRKVSLYVIHWRYYYDPPEFQTVIKGDDSKQYHIGYFRDDPHDLPCFVASNTAAVDGIITPMAENIFGAVNVYLEKIKEKCDPFRKMKVSKIQNALQTWAKQENIHLDVSSDGMRKRNRKIVTKTFHKAGMVVPVDKKTDLGYRELIETDVKLKQILSKVVNSTSEEERQAHLGKLEPIVTAANIANDECDFGTSLELGLDLFSFGGEVFHRTVRNLLTTAYTLLQRNEFAQIAEAHLRNRRKGTGLSIIEENM